jgi:hypothetical protein
MLDPSTGDARDGRPRSPGPEEDGDVVVLGAPVRNHPDPILMRAHIDRVVSEFPALDPVLIERIYQHLVVVRLRQPTRDELREYVVELTSSVDEATLRGLLGLAPPSRGAGTTRPQRSASGQDLKDGSRATRRSGRPGWSAELFRSRYRDACERTTAPHTYVAVAPHFMALDGTIGTSPEYLRKLVRRFGLPAE